MQILKWLRKYSETLSASVMRISRSDSEQRLEIMCQVSVSIALLSSAHFQLSLPPLPSH